MEVAEPTNIGPLVNVDMPVTCSCVIEPIPPITFVAIPALSAYPTVPEADPTSPQTGIEPLKSNT